MVTTNPDIDPNPAMDRRRLLQFAALGVLAAGGGLLSSCHRKGGAGASDEAINFGSFRGGDDPFAGDAGLADRLVTHRSEFASSALALQALTAGAIDITHFSGVTPVLLPANAPIKQVAAFPAASRIMKVFVAKDSGIRSLSQIKGKRVCYMRAGPLHLYLLKLLEAQGLALDQIEAINLSASDGLAAFAAGRVDVLLAGMYATCWQAEQTGARILLTGDELPGFATLNMNVFAVSAEVLGGPKRALIPRYLERTRQIWRWIDAHPEAWAQRMAGYTHAPAAYILANRTRPAGGEFLADAPTIAAQQAVADTFWHAGLIPAQADMAGHWDRTIFPQ